MKKTAYFFAAIMGILCVAAPVLAAPVCMPSARIPAVNYPGAARIAPTNNLVLPTGKALPADGQILILSGRVLDSQCAPVAEAVVELWQASPYGRWLLADSADLASVKPVFAGAGRTYTSLDGSYSFITLFPAPTAAISAPTVNIRIQARGLPEYRSMLFFDGDERNIRDTALAKINPDARRTISIHVQPNADDGLIGVLDIVLPGKRPYREY